MKRKWVLTGVALMFATMLTGCVGDLPINSLTSNIKSTEETVTDATVASTTPQTTQTTNIVPANNTLDERRALAIALNHAGVKETDATVIKNKLDYDDGRQIYEIEWYTNGAKYDYEISATNGNVINSKYELKTPVGGGNSAAISEASAKQKALARVSGASEKDIYEWKLDYDDGYQEYEGKIFYGGMEYEFTINATTGAITKWDVEVYN